MSFPSFAESPLTSQAGFPFFQLDRYLKILVQDFNRYVAIAEEFPNDASGKVKAGGLMHDRRVSRVITPGTLIDENFMDPFSNNYVLAIHANDTLQNSLIDTASRSQALVDPIGLAWLDLSTGHFLTQSTTMEMLPAFLARIGPREIVLDEDLQVLKDHGIFTILAEDQHLITYTNVNKVKTILEWTPMLESPVPSSLADTFTAQEIAAGSTLLQYVKTRLLGEKLKLQPPARQLDVMGIDKNTMRALEIRRTMRDYLFKGSLLHTVRRTVTQGGARLLERWLCQYIRKKEHILVTNADYRLTINVCRCYQWSTRSGFTYVERCIACRTPSDPFETELRLSSPTAEVRFWTR